MKNLIVIMTIALFSMSAEAKFVGGVLKTTHGNKMALKCVTTYESGACQEMNLMMKWHAGADFEVLETIQLDDLDMEEIRRNSYDRANDDLSENYQTAAYIGLVSGFGVAWVTRSGLIAVPAMVIGAAFDIVKAPVVGLFYLAHRGSDMLTKKKMMKGLKFMLDPKKSGKEKRMRKRYFSNLQYALIYR